MHKRPARESRPLSFATILKKYDARSRRACSPATFSLPPAIMGRGSNSCVCSRTRSCIFPLSQATSYDRRAYTSTRSADGGVSRRAYSFYNRHLECSSRRCNAARKNYYLHDCETRNTLPAYSRPRKKIAPKYDITIVVCIRTLNLRTHGFP